MSGAAQQQQAQAQHGMRRIPLPQETGQHPSLPLSAQRLVNWMVEKAPENARSPAALIPTPGLVPYLSFGVGPVTVLNNDNSSWIYILTGDQWMRYRGVGPDGVPPVTEVLYTIPTPDIVGRWDYLNMFTIAVGLTHAVLCSPPRAFAVSHVDGSLAVELTALTSQATSVAYSDGYFIFSSPDQGFFISALEDPFTYDALDIARTEEGGGLAVFVLNRELWFVGPNGIGIWYNSGDADFPFRPRRSATIHQGVAVPQSVALGDNSMFWLGFDAIVYRSLAYRAERISTHAIEDIILSQGSIVTSGLVTTFRGHVCYVINWDDQTVVYDCATKLWHERASSGDGTGRWRGNVGMSLDPGVGLVGDYASGQIFSQSHGYPYEAGELVKRFATLPPLWANTARAFCSRLEVEMETGQAGAPYWLGLEWSDDGGHTWTTARGIYTGESFPSAYRRRLVTTRLGSFRQRVFRLTAQGVTTIYAVDIDAVGGSW